MARPIAFIDLGPQIIRYFSTLGPYLGPAYVPVFFSLRYKSRSVLRRLHYPLYPDRHRGRGARFPEGADIDPDDLIPKLRTATDRTSGLEQTPYYRWLVGELHRFFEQLRPVAVFLWNGSGLAATIAEQLARRRGIVVIFGENGYLPNTLQLDATGVNAFSSFARTWGLDEIRALRWTEAQRQELARLLAAYRDNRLPPSQGPGKGRLRASWIAYLRQAVHDLGHRRTVRGGSRLIPSKIPRLPHAFAFFPLQVRDDSQLTVHSPLYGNRLEAAIADVRRALQEVAPGLPLVIKLHPADRGRSDYDPLVRACPEVIWGGSGDVRRLLERSVLVITVNSTVGIEGLIFGKPVVVLGRSFYGFDGLVHPVRDRRELPAVLRAASNNQPDANLVEQYLLFLYFIALTRGHWRDYSPESLRRVATRIRSMVESADPPEKSPGSNSTR